MVPEAAGHWLEVAADPGFERMTLSRWGVLLGAFAFSRPFDGRSWSRSASATPTSRSGRCSKAWACGAVRTRDEVGDLARRMNEMTVGLSERFQLAKFVSAETMAAIKGADFKGVRRGGERRQATMLSCDIRGYTAFAEQLDPEAVIEVLNLYLQHQAEIVHRHHGDVDKFVGDQIVAAFQGADMERNAIRCALEIQAATDELARACARMPRRARPWRAAAPMRQSRAAGSSSSGPCCRSRSRASVRRSRCSRSGRP